MKFTTRELTIAAMLTAISAVFQIMHVGYPTPWGMWIDLVAIPWIIAFFVYGWRTAILTAAASSIVIAVVAPSSLLGALMKFIASVPMFLIPAFLLKREYLHRWKLIIPALVAALVVRCALVIPLNYYYAIPIWTGMTVEQSMAFIPPAIMIALNAIQGIGEFAVAWLIVFKTRLRKMV